MRFLPILLSVFGLAAATTINQCEPVPPKLAECATEGELKWQPYLDFSKDSCYNTPAIGSNACLNPGLSPFLAGAATECRDPSYLQNNNVYSRVRCNHGWCAYIYGYYFQKDVSSENAMFFPGHYHDWEHVIVWVSQDKVAAVAVSVHGNKYIVRPAAEVRWDGTHPKVVYHRDGEWKHCFRFGREEDDGHIENHTGKWFRGDLVSYAGFPSREHRDFLVNAHWGDANIGFSGVMFRHSLVAGHKDGPSLAKQRECPFIATDDSDNPPPPQCYNGTGTDWTE